MKIIKKITKIGDGHSILIPKIILESLNLKAGDYVELDLKKTKKPKLITR
jgi:AbrB family looped-hinge helix DNA binding protein